MTSTPVKQIAYFRGRAASTLSRDELLMAFEHAVEELDRMRGWARTDREMDQLFATVKESFARRV